MALDQPGACTPGTWSCVDLGSGKHGGARPACSWEGLLLNHCCNYQADLQIVTVSYGARAKACRSHSAPHASAVPAPSLAVLGWGSGPCASGVDPWCLTIFLPTLPVLARTPRLREAKILLHAAGRGHVRSVDASRPNPCCTSVCSKGGIAGATLCAASPPISFLATFDVTGTTSALLEILRKQSRCDMDVTDIACARWCTRLAEGW